jgi:hypothetical protein
MKDLRVRGFLMNLVGLFFICVVVLFLSGCGETAKGFARDMGTLRKADQWFKDHYW